MTGIKLLLSPLPSDVRELDSSDQRLEDVAKLAESEQWSAVIDAVEVLFAEGSFDIRPIVLYLWSMYRREGITSVATTISALTSLTGPNLELVGPVRRRAEHVQRRVSWLFQQIANDMEFNESRKTTTWEHWETVASAEMILSWIDAAKALDAGLPSELDSIRTSISLFVLRLRRLHVVVEPAPSPLPAPQTVTLEVKEEPPIARGMEVRVGSQTAMVEIRPTTHFFELAEKLKAFSELVERAEFAKAAVVADDLTQIIEHFDPRTYFPSMFSDFAKLMSEHIVAVAAEWARKDTLAWRAQAEFYKVDLKRFVAR